MAARVRETKGEHKLIMQAIESGDAEGAVSVMRSHIAKRMDQIVASVKESYSNIYMPGAETLFDRPLVAAEV